MEKYFGVGQATYDNGICALHAGYLRLGKKPQVV